jgi:hypothetical protein
MKRLLILVPILLLVACSTTVPVKRTFPQVPAELLAECPDLKLVPEDTTELSKTLSVVVENYGQYKECQLKVDLWTEWYTKQKQIFEEVK